MERFHTPFQTTTVRKLSLTNIKVIISCRCPFLMFLAKDEVNLILDAFKAYKSKTCIKFIPRTTEKNYINITKTDSG